jgi:hypothetical protein
MTEEFGKKVYAQHLAKRDNVQKARRDENVADRETVNQRAVEHEYQQIMSKMRQYESKQKYAEQVDTQSRQLSEMQNQMAQAEKAMALRLQEDRIRSMMQKEKDAKQMRFEWRQQNERSYDRQIEEVKIKS